MQINSVLSLKWDYDKQYVDISMPHFVQSTLQKLQHQPPSKPQHSPHRYTSIQYGSTPQLATPNDTSPLIPKSQHKYIQSIVGSFLYYGRDVDPTILTAINEIGYSQAAPTESTLKKTTQLLDYLYTHPHSTLRFHKSDMCLHIDSDAAYLVAPGAKVELLDISI